MRLVLTVQVKVHDQPGSAERWNSRNNSSLIRLPSGGLRKIGLNSINSLNVSRFKSSITYQCGLHKLHCNKCFISSFICKRFFPFYLCFLTIPFYKQDIVNFTNTSLLKTVKRFGSLKTPSVFTLFLV